MNTSPPIRFGSVCSGIEAASVAWHPLGWRAAWLSEIEPFPSAVLAHHYPDVPNLGDMTQLPARVASGEIPAPDVFCGGTPCQAFSVAGLRRSLDDARGNLSLTFCEIANAIDTVRVARGEPECIVFWENVPGVLSTKDNAFGCFLAGLAGEDDPLEPAGGKWTNAGAVFGPRRTVAWRVLDAQYFGVAQRRRRLFVVASARNGFNPLAVLFEFDGVRRDSAPRRNSGQATAAGTLRSTDGGSDVDHARAAHLIASGNAEGSTGLPFLTCSNIGKTVNNQTPLMAFETVGPLMTHHSPKGHGCAGVNNQQVAAGHIVPVVGALCRDSFTGGMGGRPEGAAAGHVLAFHGSQDPDVSGDVTHPVGRNQGQETCVQRGMQVRRLTPRECERLQGFPDDYTLIPWRKKSADQCPDGPRYKALGNSWAIPCVSWIGNRINRQLLESRYGEQEEIRQSHKVDN